MAYDKFAAVDSSTLLFPPTVRANLAAVSPNYIINGGFDIWQRGTSFTNPAAFTAFTADRWTQGFDGSGGTRTWTQQAHTPGAAPIAGSTEAAYYLRCAQSVAGSGASYNMLFYKVEDVRTLAGQTLSFSFYAKATATLTMPSIDFEQSFGSGGSSNVYTGLTSNISVGTSWTRYTYTVSLPSISGKTIGTNSYLGIRIFMPINTTFTFDIWGVQLEAGSTATPFRRNANSIQGELAACQRYFFRVSGATGNSTGIALAVATGGTAPGYRRVNLALPTTMRTKPTVTSAGNIWAYTAGLTNIGWGTIQNNYSSTSAISVDVNSSSAATIGTPLQIIIDSSNATDYIEASAEL